MKEYTKLEIKLSPNIIRPDTAIYVGSYYATDLVTWDVSYDHEIQASGCFSPNRMISFDVTRYLSSARPNIIRIKTKIEALNGVFSVTPRNIFINGYAIRQYGLMNLTAEGGVLKVEAGNKEELIEYRISKIFYSYNQQKLHLDSRQMLPIFDSEDYNFYIRSTSCQRHHYLEAPHGASFLMLDLAPLRCRGASL